jgi:hypothetical protein
MRLLLIVPPSLSAAAVISGLAHAGHGTRVVAAGSCPAGQDEVADFERLYSNVGGANYVWYQFRLQVQADELYDRAGSASVRRLFDAFRLDDDALARRLAADVDPGLAEFSLAF